MNRILKALIYTILLIISMLGGLVATLFGIVGLAFSTAAILKLEFGYSQMGYIFVGLIMAFIGILGQRFFNSLDPALMYYEEDL